MSNLVTYERIELGGKEFLLKFDYNAACDLEDIFGKGIAGILTEEQVGFKLVRAFYWAGLKWKEKGLTLDRVGYMLGKEIQENGKDIGGLMEPIMNALKKSKLMGNDEDNSIDAEYTEVEDNENPNV